MGQLPVEKVLEGGSWCMIYMHVYVCLGRIFYAVLTSPQVLSSGRDTWAGFCGGPTTETVSRRSPHRRSAPLLLAAAGTVLCLR